MQSNDFDRLGSKWQSLHEGAGQAIEWIAHTRTQSARLDNEADDLMLSLRRVRNTAQRLGSVSSTPMTVGFFGLSQAGKSYLISSLAVNEAGKLETVFGGSRLDFLSHVNPPGQGAEATGLVTRFSRMAQAGPGSHPIELKVFSEIELAKIVSNSFHEDFNRERFDYEHREDRLQSHVKQLSERRRANRVDGVGGDDVVALWDYLADSFSGSLKPLNATYWPAAIELAPHLCIEDRAALFSVLWGEVPELTNLYVRLARTLARLGNPSRVHAPLHVLVRRLEDESFSQADSIMNVNMLDRLGQDSDFSVRVRPKGQDGSADEVDISAAELAALTVELMFPLVEPTRDPLFEEVDLLDFPGYRGRLNVESMGAVQKALGNESGNAVAQLFLRGKVAYLFERYTDSQEMNVLIVCTPSTKQSDVTSVGPVLNKWISATQGSTPDVRGRRRPGLIWAITMFDIRVQANLSATRDNVRISWGAGGLMKLAMLERFGEYSWLQEWQPTQAFNNTFLVRKPGLPVPFLQIENNREVMVHPDSMSALALQRETFIDDETVKRHVAAPDEAWDAMIALNDGGMGRLSAYLRTVALRQVKLDRIQEQYDDVMHQVGQRLGRWYHADGASDLAKKREIARKIIDGLKRRWPLLGELIWRLQPSDESLRSLYFGTSVDDPSGVGGSDATEPDSPSPGPALNLDADSDDELFADLFDDPVPMAVAAPDVLPSSSRPKASGSDARFAKAVLRDWIGHMRHVVERDDLVNYLGIEKAVLEELIDELVTAVNRLGFEARLLGGITRTEQSGSKREQLVGRQVLTAQTIIADFLAWLGLVDEPLEKRPNSRGYAGRKLFQSWPEVAPGELPKLKAEDVNHTTAYISDWFVALIHLIENNAGHSAGRDISPEMNDRLGRILRTIRAETEADHAAN